VTIECVLQNLSKWVHDSVFWYPMLLSLLSALIFWVVFEYIPAFVRKKRIAPIFQADFRNLESLLSLIFETIMRATENSPSQYQRTIASGQLDKESIKIGLASKCYNETYLFDPVTASRLQPIGASLYRTFEQISLVVDKIYVNRNFLSPGKEILLNAILQKVSSYYPDSAKITGSAITMINGTEFRPAVTSMIGEVTYFDELYQLYRQVQDYVFSTGRGTERNFLLGKLRRLVSLGSHKKALEVVKVLRRKHPNDSGLIDLYEVSSLRSLHRTKKFYTKLEKYLMKRYYGGSLVSSRSLLKLFLEDSGVMELVQKYYSTEEVAQLLATIESEKMYMEAFLAESKSLLDYFASRDPRLRML